MFATNAYAMAGGASGQQGGGMEGILMLLIMFGIFYLLLIRPQQKRAKQHKELVENLKSGDLVVTAGGIHGKIIAVEDKYLTLEIASNVKIKINRNSILGPQSEQPEEK
ncbi:MAG: preprotein translocase subunit YajC [Deltaproteobacteria bacterium]|jgi:preprotein translocase subunit YajC|nr:preprotein translocase subunit YajC [Deltaproteobacteria bacterium]MBW2476644.1 preprotein translocase subunit YajC [Deltaproteobacteria bacterium]MBW2519061.1 preprotein translocase subunit YajC [Deltaproteobacteria bacterium]